MTSTRAIRYSRGIAARRRLADARRWAGYRSAHIARSTGTLVVVVRNDEAMLDEAGGAYSTICDDHGEVIAHETLRLARYHASAPEQWCEVCMGNRPPESFCPECRSYAEVTGHSATRGSDPYDVEHLACGHRIVDLGDGPVVLS